MKIMATFDESPFSEAAIPILAMLATVPDAEIELLSVSEVTAARGDDAIRKRQQELESYLRGIVTRLPSGPTYLVSTDVAMFPIDAATVLVERAESEHPDLIVMTTHGRSGVVRALLGSVAEKVVQSGAAPVLLVRPRPKD